MLGAFRICGFPRLECLPGRCLLRHFRRCLLECERPAVSGYPRRVHPDQSARICPWDSVAVLIAGGIVSTTIISICMRYVSSLALVCGVVCIPLVLLCLVIVMTKLGETKGVDMAKITGAEFDG